MKILMVLIFYDQMGDIGYKIGFWLEEFIVFYYVFCDVGVDIMIVFLKGGQLLVDFNSEVEDVFIEIIW